MPSLAAMPVLAGMQSIAVTQAAAVTPATSNSNDESNSTTVHKSRNVSYNRNLRNNRTTNTVGAPTTEEMLAKVMKPAPACREDNNNMDTINIRDGSSSCRGASNIQQGRQQQV